MWEVWGGRTAARVMGRGRLRAGDSWEGWGKSGPGVAILQTGPPPRYACTPSHTRTLSHTQTHTHTRSHTRSHNHSHSRTCRPYLRLTGQIQSLTSSVVACSDTAITARLSATKRFISGIRPTVDTEI